MISSMRATVTIDDDLFEEADAVAEQMGISRSGLYQEALRRYLEALRERALTAQVDEHIRIHGQPDGASFQRYVGRVWAQEMGDDEW